VPPIRLLILPPKQFTERKARPASAVACPYLER
jgi:hypothetical protein